MPGTKSRQAGTPPYSSMAHWPDTWNSRWPRVTMIPAGGSQVMIPAGSSLATAKKPA